MMVQLFTLLKSNLAYHRTDPHPLDSGVRIASCKEDMCAVHWHHAKAAILPGALPVPVMNELIAIERYITPGFDFHFGPVVTSGNNEQVEWKADHLKAKDTLRQYPAMLGYIAHCCDVFRYVSGSMSDDLASGGALLESQKLAAPDAADYLKIFNDLLSNSDPHGDNGADNFLVTLSARPNTGTYWFPGTYSQSQRSGMAGSFKLASNRKAFLSGFNVQILQPGDCLAIKSEDGRRDEEILVHGATMPHPEAARFLFKYSS